MALLISPAEPVAIRAIGKVSQLPERNGVDFMFPAQGKWVGVQRKELHDLISSIADGRLQRELGQMGKLDIAMLIIEGPIKWTLDGALMLSGYGQPFTRKQLYGLMWSVRRKGVWVERTESMDETIEVVEMLEAWATKAKHSSLDRRPGPTSVWGKPDHIDYARHLVMGLPGVGPELAARIVERFGGVPFGWRITEDELREVQGVGKVKAKAIYGALGRVEP